MHTNKKLPTKISPNTQAYPVKLGKKEQRFRHFKINDQQSNEATKQFPSNYIKTTKYTLLTFLPVALFNQFKRVANIYFLIIVILQSISVISPLNPSTAIAPLVFVLGISLIREAIEDYKRYKADKLANAFEVEAWKEGKWEVIQSRDIKIGQILRIKDEQTFPCDIVLLASSSAGQCFIETSSLDGEKNLKKRTRPEEIAKYVEGVNGELYELIMLYGDVTSEMPNNELYSLRASIKINKETIGFSEKQLLLKGSTLKNTTWIIGFVVYTGVQTKLMMNSQKGRFKQSNVEKMMNKLVFCILVAQLVLCLILAIIGTILYSQDARGETYLVLINSTGSSFIITLCSYFLLLNTLIPISLIVTLELVKAGQGLWMSYDIKMYSYIHKKFVNVTATSINEELGQVSYIFSDKTGTLTRNIMEFKLCLIGGILFGDNGDLDESSSPLRRKPTYQNKKDGLEYAFRSQLLEGCVDNICQDPLGITIKSNSGKESVEFPTLNIIVHEFLKLLSITNDCLPETKNVNGVEKLFYNGQSPDEIALVEFAAISKFTFCESTEASAIVKFPDDEYKTFEVFRRIEFTSARKRMSIIFRDPIDGKYKLFCKGADNIIMERLSERQKDKDLLERAEDFLKKASVKGYRTLCMAMRVLDREEFTKLKEIVLRAESSVDGRDEELAKIYDSWERDLVLLGCTAVEDRLQDKVSNTIAQLQEAGIKIWMLTGDKLETAENIAKSCRLIPVGINDDFVIKCATTDEKEVKKIFGSDLAIKNEERLKHGRPMCILVENTSLKIILNPKNMIIRDTFIKIAKTCEAVICCRVSPSEKADVVRMIKHTDPELITLSIGDGANDVSMIQEAHIGIGLYGNEGMRAVQSSDFALGEFQFLWRLLLVHGRLSYYRVSEMVLYFFYKNIVFTLPQFYFAFFSSYSSQSVFDDWYITFYNLFFTSFPLLIKAMFEQDINPELDGESLYEAYPKLYYTGQYKMLFSWKTYIFAVIQGLIHSAIVFFIPYYALSGIFMKSGMNSDLWTFSTASFTSIIIVVTIKLMVTTKYYAWPFFASIFAWSLPFYFGYIYGSNWSTYNNAYLTLMEDDISPIYYLSIFLSIGSCFCIDYAIHSIRILFYESPIDFMQLQVAKNKKKSSDEVELAFSSSMVNGVNYEDFKEEFLDRVEQVESRLRVKTAIARRAREEQVARERARLKRNSLLDEVGNSNYSVEMNKIVPEAL